jgi:hypothetical protein
LSPGAKYIARYRAGEFKGDRKTDVVSVAKRLAEFAGMKVDLKNESEENPEDLGLELVPREILGLGYKWYPVLMNTEDAGLATIFAGKEQDQQPLEEEVLFNVLQARHPNIGRSPYKFNQRLIDPLDILDDLHALASKTNKSVIGFIPGLDTMTLRDNETKEFIRFQPGSDRIVTSLTTKTGRQWHVFFLSREREDARIFNWYINVTKIDPQPPMDKKEKKKEQEEEVSVQRKFIYTGRPTFECMDVCTGDRAFFARVRINGRSSPSYEDAKHGMEIKQWMDLSMECWKDNKIRVSMCGHWSGKAEGYGEFVVEQFDRLSSDVMKV